MDNTTHSRLVAFIWSIADDCLRDVYVRGKYRDVILPMVVLRRLDVLLEPTKDKVMAEMWFQREEMGVTEWEPDGLKEASDYVFYNLSDWTLQKLCDTATKSQQLLFSNVEEYLNGYSPNVQEIITKFQLQRQLAHMADKDVLLNVLEKFTSPNINLTPFEQTDSDGRKLPPLTNLGMGYVFEELIRKFNEENNEEAGEHFTPREVIHLMTHLLIEPVQAELPTVITIYDPACGSGGMLTESQNLLESITNQQSDVYLYGKEINDETYAICKSDMMIKGNNPEHIRNGSTLSTDEFVGETFNFMLSNPPYGKSWASEVKYIKSDKQVVDNRFVVELSNYWGILESVEATPRTSDGQLLFLMEMISKMKPSTIGSRIASVHNGSSLFTGDAGSGESNIRRYLIENDLLDCIIQLPNNLFYNTGITTYIWIVTNRKPAARQGQVLLIDASQQFTKLRKNLGAKNCELSAEHIQAIVSAYTDFALLTRDTGSGLAAQLFENTAFGYYKVVIERPKRLMAQFSAARIAVLRFDKNLHEPMQWAYQQFGERVYTELAAIAAELLVGCEAQGLELNAKQRKTLSSSALWDKQLRLLTVAEQLLTTLGTALFTDFNEFAAQVDAALKNLGVKLSAAEKNTILQAVSWYDAAAAKVVKKRQRLDDKALSALLARLGCCAAELADFGYFPSDTPGEYVLYETESELRDSESVPLQESVHGYFLREVQPHVAEAWIDLEKTKIGYEISFNRYFYQHQPLRSLAAVSEEILALEAQSEGLIWEILQPREDG